MTPNSLYVRLWVGLRLWLPLLPWLAVSHASAVVPAEFSPGTNFSAGRFPQCVVNVDLNHDGLLDLVVTTADGLNVLPGRGAGAFGAPTNYPYYPFGSGFLDTGDFNNDGHADIVEADHYNTRIFLGDGTGRLSLLTNYCCDGSYTVYPSAIAVGDLNGDGNDDFAVANTGNPSGRAVTLGFGRGDGTFSAPTNFSLAGGTPGDIALGDLNHDGKLDAAVSMLSAFTINETNNVIVLTNRGDGTLVIAEKYTADTRDTYYALMLLDMDQTGDLDLAVLHNNAQSVAIRLNTGFGTFGPAQHYRVPFSPTSVTAADFNGDEKVDLIVRGGSAAVLFLGDGSGSFMVGNPIQIGPDARSSDTLSSGDFDGNGTPDLALSAHSYTNPYIEILLNQTPPILNITRSAGQSRITWLTNFGAGFVLECKTNLATPGTWQTVPDVPVQSGNKKTVTDASESGQKYYRLRKP